MSADHADTPSARGYRQPAEWAPHEATWLSWPHNRDSWPGVFAGVFDLGIGPRCAVPRVPTADGDRVTAVSLRLAPGEGTCLSLISTVAKQP